MRTRQSTAAVVKAATHTHTHTIYSGLGQVLEIIVKIIVIIIIIVVDYLFLPLECRCYLSMCSLGKPCPQVVYYVKKGPSFLATTTLFGLCAK